MQFLVTGWDGDDTSALSRRLAAREAHLSTGDRLKAEGHLLFATAILNDEGGMIGSVLIFDFPSRDELDACLRNEPYVTGDVWKRIEIHPCRVGPSFARSNT